MNSKLAIIGVILITSGTTLAITSYFNVNYWQTQLFYRTIFVLDPNSSFSQWLRLDKPMSLKQIQVQIEPSGEIADFLNSTMLSTYHLGVGLNPITVTLGDPYRNISADLITSAKMEGGGFELTLEPVHVFDIPDDWSTINNITITNPENHPVILIAVTTGTYLLVNSNWQTAMYNGIASVAVGAAITGISVLRRKQVVEQKETATES
jgi:hypothetical protein